MTLRFFIIAVLLQGLSCSLGDAIHRRSEYTPELVCTYTSPRPCGYIDPHQCPNPEFYKTCRPNDMESARSFIWFMACTAISLMSIMSMNERKKLTARDCMIMYAFPSTRLYYMTRR